MHSPIHNFKLPVNPQGKFAAPRRFDVHTGIDLYCKDGEAVFAMTDGTVQSVEKFTGEKAGSPWWENTDCIILKDRLTGQYIVYGEVISCVKVGDFITAGTQIGNVKRVLKKNKGLPMSMLHLEYYDKNWDCKLKDWLHDKKKPEHIQDPTQLLLPNYLVKHNVKAELSYINNGAIYYNARVNKDVFRFPVVMTEGKYMSEWRETRQVIKPQYNNYTFLQSASCAMFYDELKIAAMNNSIVRI